MNCRKCGQQINSDDLFCSYCGTQQSVYCKHCGNNIDGDALFCPKCGFQLESQNDNKKVGASFISSIKNKLHYESNDTNNVIDIPEGYHLCAYCGEIKPRKDFWTLLDNEFCMCNKCHQREKKIFHSVVVAACLILAFFITLFSIDGAVNDGNIIYYLDNQGNGFLSFIIVCLLVLAVFYNITYEFLIKSVLKHTPWRISLSKKRKKWLRECKDTNGRPIVTQITRTPAEEAYKEITGVYLSRDIPDGYFICPCCEHLHPLSCAVSINSEDNEHKRGTRWIGGAYIQRTTIKYKSLVCPDCYKIKKRNKRFRVILPIIIVAIALVVVTYLYYDVLKTDSPGLVIFGMTVGATMSAFILSIIVSFVYKLCIYIFTRKNLFYRYQDAANYGALSHNE